MAVVTTLKGRDRDDGCTTQIAYDAIRYNPTITHVASDYSRMSSALHTLDSGMPRAEWIRASIAAKAAGIDFDDWLNWCAGADNYNGETDCRSVWQSIESDGEITAGTLIHMAREAGWHDDGRNGIGHAMRPPIPRTSSRPAASSNHAVKIRERTAQWAAAIWAKAAPASADHLYLVRKGVAPTDTLRRIDVESARAILGYRPASLGEQLSGELLVVPVYQPSGLLATLELIDGEGRKAALAGIGTKKGGYWPAQSMPEGSGNGETFFIAEGVATALTGAQAKSHPAVATLTASNMLTVAKAMRKQYPAARLVLLADLTKTTGEPIKEAVDAARAVNGLLAVPAFGDDRSPEHTDFNDMARVSDFGAVSAAIDGAKSVTTAENGVADDTDKTRKCDFAGGHFELTSQGVVYQGADNGGKPPPKSWICAPLHVKAATRDAKSSDWGRLLEWQDRDGVIHQWAMPLELLQGDCLEIRKALARRGLAIATSRKARELLTSYLQVWPVDTFVRCTARMGWHGNVYVTPSESIGKTDEIVMFQHTQAIEPALATAGTVSDWRDNVAALAAGNSRVAFALAVAFAGPLVKIVAEDSGGFHLRGASSTGKTTALEAAASVWGNPRMYMRRWRATTNGLEGLALLHNDGVLILDELSQIDPREAGQAAYMLANGQGKNRANQSGAARESARWRVLVLSSGEEPLEALIARAGGRVNAGQDIRLADIEADAGANMGAFELLHDRPNPGALALAIRDASARYHGAVGIEWLRRIVADLDTLPIIIADGVRQFIDENVPANASAQVHRVARRFALVAVAGQLATHYGLTGWAEAEADEAAQKCFAAWLANFGTESHEDGALINQVRGFLDAHGASRFEKMDSPNEQKTINRVGYYRIRDGIPEYLVLPGAFATEVCKGFSQSHAAKVLIEAGMLIAGKNGKTSSSLRLPHTGKTGRVYVLRCPLDAEN